MKQRINATDLPDNLKVFTQSIGITCGIALAAAGVAGLLKDARFGLGVLVSAGWMLVNLGLLRQVALVLGEAGSNPRRKSLAVFLLMIVKFPVLYYVGYLILASRWFPAVSLLIGFSLWIIGFLGVSIRRAVPAVACALALGVASSAFASEAGHAAGIEMPELPNGITLVSRWLHGHEAGSFLHLWETSIFTLLIIAGLVGAAWAATRGLKMRLLPDRAQGLAEVVVGEVNNFVCGIIGPEGRQFTPFLGTLFLYIWVSNLAGLVPLLKSPTTGFRSIPGFPIPMIPITTLPLALAVFGYVQWTAVRRRGILGYIDHLAGEPRNPFTIAVAPIMLVLHLLGEILTKPLSLSFRLFGNISSEDAVVAVLVGMGFAFLWVEFPILWLALILSTIQAVVFTLLSTIYIAMILPHEHEEHYPINEKGVKTHAVGHD